MKFKGLTIEKLKPRDILKTSKFARRIISSLAIYNKKARTAFSKELSPSGLRNELKHGAVFVIKNKRGEILGFLNYQPSNSGMGWADWVLIDDAYRNKGLSSAISKYAFSFAKSHGEHTVWADSRTNNRKAIRLIKKFGFKKLGLFRKAWYKQDYYLWYKNI